jgi:hypothetical protein
MSNALRNSRRNDYEFFSLAVTPAAIGNSYLPKVSPEFAENPRPELERPRLSSFRRARLGVSA